MAEKKVPKLRFPEFKRDWDIAKLKDITKINPSNKTLPDEFYYIDLESVKNGILGKIDIVKKEEAPSRAKRLVDKGDILYQTVRPYQKNNLHFNYDKKLSFVASTGYALLRCNKSDSRFIYQLIHSNVFVNKVLSRSTGTSYPAINTRDLSSIKIKLPTRKEQEKIGSFFSKIDKKIELQEELIKNLEKQKKGFMQKIFNQEVRFKDEYGENYPEWEEKKLGNLFNLITSRRKDSFKEGKYIIMDMGTVTQGGKLLKHKRTNEAEEFLFKGDLIMPKDDIGKGNIICKTGYIPSNNLYVLSDHVFALRKKKEDINSKFYHYHINTENVNLSMRKKVTGSAQLGINQKSVLMEVLKKPSIKEQKKIADFLFLADKKIDLEKEQLENYKEYKKGLMQRMFI